MVGCWGRLAPCPTLASSQAEEAVQFSYMKHILWQWMAAKHTVVRSLSTDHMTHIVLITQLITMSADPHNVYLIL